MFLPLLLLPVLAQQAPTVEGIWVEDKTLSENPDALLAAQGVPWAIRKLIASGTATEVIVATSDQVEITTKLAGATRTHGGVPDGEPRSEGDAVDTWSWSGGTLVQTQTKTQDGKQLELVVTREVVGSDRMLVHYALKVDGQSAHAFRQVFQREG
jgi:hypothetical protein